MVQKKETLPAIKVVDEILRLATTISPKEVKEALHKIAVVEGTYGLLWGLGNLRVSGMDVDYFGLKKKVLEFLRELQEDEHFNLAHIVAATREQT